MFRHQINQWGNDPHFAFEFLRVNSMSLFLNITGQSDCSGGSTISQGVTTYPPGGGGREHTIWTVFSQKLHGNEDILARGGWGRASLVTPPPPRFATAECKITFNEKSMKKTQRTLRKPFAFCSAWMDPNNGYHSLCISGSHKDPYLKDVLPFEFLSGLVCSCVEYWPVFVKWVGIRDDMFVNESDDHLKWDQSIIVWMEKYFTHRKRIGNYPKVWWSSI